MQDDGASTLTCCVSNPLSLTLGPCRIPRMKFSVANTSSSRSWNFYAQGTDRPQASHSSSEASKRSVLLSLAPLLASALHLAPASLAAEQGIQPSDYTVPALTASQYADKIRCGADGQRLGTQQTKPTTSLMHNKLSQVNQQR